MVNKVGGVSHLGGAENGEVIAKKIIATRVITMRFLRNKIFLTGGDYDDGSGLWNESGR